MAQLDENELKSQIKEGAFSNSYLIYGNEPYLKQHYVNLIAKKCVSADMEGFNLRKFDAENNASLDELITATDTLPVFSEYTCTVIKDFPLDSIYSSEKEKFEEWIKNMPETSVAVFWQDTTEINLKKNAKWKNLVSLFSKYGESVCLDKMDRLSLAKTVASGLKKRGITADKQVALYLTQTVGDDLNILLNEVEKISDYKKSGELTFADIDAVCVKSLEANVFDLSKALLSKDLSKSLSILTKLLQDKEKPELILGVLSSNFIDMYRVKVCALCGKSADFLKEFYNYKNLDFKLRNAQRDCRNIDIRQLKHCIMLLQKADEKIKLRSSDDKTVLETLLVELNDAVSN